jgi:FAD-linked sulfhydryl oxidase
VLLLIAVSAVIAFTFVYSFRSQEVGVRHPLANGSGAVPAGAAPAYAEIQESTLSGHVIAPKLGNETAKYVAVANLFGFTLSDIAVD